MKRSPENSAKGKATTIANPLGEWNPGKINSPKLLEYKAIIGEDFPTKLPLVGYQIFQSCDIAMKFRNLHMHIFTYYI